MMLIINEYDQIINGITYHFTKYDNGTIVKQAISDSLPNLPSPPILPNLSTVNQKLDFLIDELHLKDRFLPTP
ncbi:hypothetical protein ES703_35477 [subsurface metagenome]